MIETINIQEINSECNICYVQPTFECKFCKRKYVSTDGVRKHCRKIHPDIAEQFRGNPLNICNIITCNCYNVQPTSISLWKYIYEELGKKDNNYEQYVNEEFYNKEIVNNDSLWNHVNKELEKI